MPVKRSRAKAAPGAEAGELRERIVAASIELIEAEGLARLSMREVARRAGVTHQAPYHHFADREAILGEIAARGFRLLMAEIERVAAAIPIGGGAEREIDRLMAIGTAYVDFACTYPAHFRIMFRPELVDLENCPGARAEGDNAFSAFRRIVHAAVDAGIPAQPSEEALVACLWSIVHGLSCLLLDGPLAMKMPETAREVQIEAVMGATRSLLTAALRAKPSGARKVTRTRVG